MHVILLFGNLSFPSARTLLVYRFFSPYASGATRLFIDMLPFCIVLYTPAISTRRCTSLLLHRVRAAASFLKGLLTVINFSVDTFFFDPPPLLFPRTLPSAGDCPILRPTLPVYRSFFPMSKHVKTFVILLLI